MLVDVENQISAAMVCFILRAAVPKRLQYFSGMRFCEMCAISRGCCVTDG